jgi:transposase
MSESFIHTMPLQISPETAKILLIRLDAGRNLYNAILSESLSRLKKARASQEWISARSLPNEKASERKKLFKCALKNAKFSEYDLHLFVKTIIKSCWIGDHIDSSTAQKTATRAFLAVDGYRKGKRGKPRFKGVNQFKSIEGKSNLAGIRFKDGKIIWQGLSIPLLFDHKDRHGVEAHALLHKVKYVRIVKRRVHGTVRFYAQLVLEGKPLIKKKQILGKGKVGLDIGPSTIAIYGEKADLLQFCPDLKKNQKKIRLIQREMERSRRAANPKKFDSFGKILSNQIPWNFSNKYRSLQIILEEEYRKMASHRKTQHGFLANRILRIGIFIHTEKLSYKSFQRMFGRSVGLRAPGMFLGMLRRKAANAGGNVIEFSTQTTKLSQTCHNCGNQKKKSLNERWHKCSCGISPMQRDLYSAFLAYHVEENKLDRSQAIKAWPGAESLLGQALSRCLQTANGKPLVSSFGIYQRQSGSPAKGRSTQHEVLCSNMEHDEECLCLATRTP